MAQTTKKLPPEMAELVRLLWPDGNLWPSPRWGPDVRRDVARLLGDEGFTYRLGEKWLRRDGKIARIEGVNEHGNAYTDTGWWHRRDGHPDDCHSEPTPLDLMCRIGDQMSLPERSA